MIKLASIVGICLCSLGLLVATNAGANEATTKKRRAPRAHAVHRVANPGETAAARDQDPDILPPDTLDLRNLYLRYGCGASILIFKPYPCRVPFEE